MKQGNTSNLLALFLLSAALLQFTLLLISIISTFFMPVQARMQPQLISFLIALVLLGIATVGARQLHTQQKTTSFSPRLDIPLGLSLGVISAVLLFIPGLGPALAWATLGFPWLIGLLILSPTSLATISPLFILLSTALYVVFLATYATCSCQVTRRTGSVREGLLSSFQAVMATLLGASLTFTFIDVVAYFIFHTGSALVRASSLADLSPLMNYVISYQGAVAAILFWSFIPVVLGLLISLASAFLSSALRPILLRYVQYTAPRRASHLPPTPQRFCRASALRLAASPGHPFARRDRYCISSTSPLAWCCQVRRGIFAMGARCRQVRGGWHPARQGARHLPYAISFPNEVVSAYAIEIERENVFL